MLEIDVPDVSAARMRQAGRDLLSLALIEARNHTLRLVAAAEQALGPTLDVPLLAEINPPLWELGHVGWFQEYWIGRNVQRHRGEACDATHPKLASVLDDADRLYDSSNVPHESRWQLPLPDLEATRGYLVETLESTLELLAAAPEDDDALYFYRLALFHEDMHAEAFAILAQTLGFETALVPHLPALATRDALCFPALRWPLGAAPGGFVFDNEKWAHEVLLPEFEIDAQPVSWAQYGEFVEDGGYDDARHWSEAGWNWVQRLARRTPRHVEQMRHAVLQRRFGKVVRVSPAQPVLHVSWYEAEAWCRWAGRRLPSEVEWEAAAHQGARIGFRHGEVWEWTATTFRPYPGFTAAPWRDYSQPWFGSHKVLRGASFATRARMRSLKYRNFYRPERDDLFCGFRSCAV